MSIKKAVSNVKRLQKAKEREALLVSDEAQHRLAEILADAPRIERTSFDGTEWEMRPLRYGTQYLIIHEVCKINQAESATYGDIIKQMAVQMPATFKVLALALLNDQYLIYKNGNSAMGYSSLFQKTYNTIMWEGEKNDLFKMLLDCLQMIDVSFFMEALGMLQIFRASVTEKKRMRKKTSQLQSKSMPSAKLEIPQTF